MLYDKAIFYPSLNKKPKREEILTYNQVKDSLDTNEYVLDLKSMDLICLDIDNQKSRDLLEELLINNDLSHLAYTYKPQTGSFHFFFKNNKYLKNILKNKHNYLSFSGIEYEILDRKVVFSNSETQRHNLDNINDFPNLDILFFPALNLNKKWAAFSGIEERINNLQGAKEGDKRSENLLVLASNLLRLNKYYQAEDLSRFYKYYNNYILEDCLSRNEINNNIKKVLNQFNKSQNASSVFIQALHLTENGKYKFNLSAFVDIFINEYKIKKYNGEIFIFLDNKYLSANEGYQNKGELFFYLLKLKINEINDLAGHKVIEINMTKYREIWEQIYLSVTEINTNQTNANLIRVANGVLSYDNNARKFDFVSGIVYDYDVFSYLDIKYNPLITENEKIDNWLRSLFKRNNKQEEDKLIQVFWEMLGTVLVDNNNNLSVFLFKGYSGRNGKSTIMQFIARFVGSKNVSSLNYEQLTDADFALSALRNKKVNLTDETPSYFDANNVTFKSLISGEVISNDIKFKRITQWKNFATLIFASNYNLKFKKLNQAISDRLYIIELRNRFIGEKDIKNIEEILLSEERDYQYVLNKALGGFERLIDNHYIFTNTEDNFNNHLEIIFDNEPVKLWLYLHHFFEDIKYGIQEDFILNDKFINIINKDSAIEMLERYKNWYKEYMGVESNIGLGYFKEKMNEMGVKTIMKDNGKEYFVYEK
ncbi:DUF5906 domain-containing protein [Mycoplasmopsis gallinarum]|uniref:DUF5906 domain-containing protein n=1 Tax=Mycoplasmopsis gallinarum TaxID=29557 RepID=UPI0004800D98|nr:DUF5906 domain-containing protein [Mycoplasmopsis gallinarum]